MAPSVAFTDDAYLDPDGRVELVLRSLRGGQSVVLLGPPGIGKSRLLAECGAQLELAPRIEAQPASTLDAFLVHVAEAVACPLPPAASFDERARRVGQHLAQARVVLLLDGLERLPSQVEGLLQEWVSARPGGYVLASRRAFGFGAAVTAVEIACLPTVRSGADWAPAAELLRVRAREHARVRLEPGDAEAVHELARALDGIPLALELMATKLGILTPAQALELVRRDASALEPARDAALDATVRASYELLDPSARTCLQAASVFRGGFTLDALAGVLADGNGVYRALQTLRDQSLVRTERRGSVYRFELLRSVQQLAEREARREPARVAEWNARHLGFVLGLQPAQLRDDVGNVQHAFERSCEERLAQAGAVALRWTHPLLGLSYERTCEIVTRALESTPEGAERAELWLRRGTARRFLADLPGAAADLELARAAAERAGDARLHAESLAGLGNVAAVTADWKTGRHYLERALCIHPGEGYRPLGLTMVANTYCNEDDHDVAEPMMRDAVALSGGGTLAAGVSRLALGVLLVEKGQLEEGFAWLSEAEGILREYGHWRAIALTYLGRIRQESGHLADALELYERARVLIDAVSVRRAEAILDLQCGLLYLELGQLDAADASLRRALVAARDTCPDHEGFILAAQAVLGVLRGAVADRERMFLRAAAALEPFSRPIFGAAVQILRGEPPTALSEELRGSSDVRWAQRMVGKMGAAVAAATVLVGESSSWFSVDSGTVVSLARRKSIQALFGALVRARLERPGSLVAVGELVRIGWPGETLVSGSGAERVYAAIATLRKLGLRGVVEQQDDGYRLRAEARVIAHAAAAP